MINTESELLKKFNKVVETLDTKYCDRSFGENEQTEKEFLEIELRKWLDNNEEPLDWAHPKGTNKYPHITDDEWFFITNLYGLMNVKQQRSHIRKFYPSLFVKAAKREIRNFILGMPEYNGLRAPWMKKRLYMMGDILRQHSITMEDYTNELRDLDQKATPDNPTPALTKIFNDLKVTEGKTLSVFVRDCVRGKCFPIDSRVRNLLVINELPEDERTLVRLSLLIGRNPRELARMFYESG